MAIRDLPAELRHAARTLRRTPGFTILAIGTLALAIGALAALYTVVYSVLLRPFPFADPERLVNITITAPGSQMPDEFDPATEFYLEYRERSTLLEDVSNSNSFTNTLRVGDRAERLRMSWVSYTLFSTLGVQPAIGRLPTEQDGETAVVISDALWRDCSRATPRCSDVRCRFSASRAPSSA